MTATTTATRTPATAVTYSRLRSGEWGVRGPAAKLAAGYRVTVTRRDGTTSEVVIGRILWTGDGVALATIEYSSSSSSSSSSRSSSRSSRAGGTCDECGRYSRSLEGCSDSSGIGGMCCPRCASAPSYERSFA